MDDIFIRVDNRLVHGQILEGWIPFIKASRIVVVNDEVAGDIYRETVIRMAIPSDIEVLVYGVDEFAGEFSHVRNNRKRTIILLGDVDDLLRAYRAGFHFDYVNIGNIHCDNGMVSCSPSISLSKDDIQRIMHLVSEGVKVELRCMPRDKPLDAREVIEKLKD